MSIVGKIDFLLGEDLALENTAFKKFFMKKLKKFGVDEPDKLSTPKKKKFFQEVEDEWKAKNESSLLTEASLESIMMQYGPYAAGKKMGILNPKESGKAGETKQYPGTGKEYFKPGKVDQKIPGDKTDVKGYPGTHDVNYHPDKQDTKIPGDKTDIKGFPGKQDANYRPEKQDVKIAGNKGDVKGYPGDPEAHYNPKKVDQKIPTKDKGVVKSFPGTGQEHYDPKKQDTKIPGDKTDIKGFPGDHKARHDKSVLGYDRDARSDQTDPPISEMFENPNTKIFSAYEKSILADQATDDVEDTQDKYGPMKYAKDKGLVDKKKKKKKEDKDNSTD